ncbi:MAG: redoxin domain-containing protein [Bradymonadia bacterium]
MSITRSFRTLALAALALTALTVSAEAVEVGKAAPAFSATDHAGTTHTQETHKGKYVVVEWLNHGCPYVRKHYDSKNMQALQAKWTAKGVVWLSVISSAPGKQGHSDAAKAKSDYDAKEAKATAVLLDPEGKMGKAYGARTTPQMVIIDPQGKVIYSGGIDSTASADPADIAQSTNYVDQALTEAMAGKAVSMPKTQPYGCSVKYAAQ